MINLKKAKNYLIQKEVEETVSIKKKSKTLDKEKLNSKIEQTIVCAENIKPLRCDKCGSTDLKPYLKDEKDINSAIEPREIFDVQGGKLVKVVLNKIRYVCNACSEPHTFTLDDLYPEKVKFSPEFENFIAQTVVKPGNSERTVAMEYGISKTTVSNALNSYIQKFHNSDFKVYPCETIYFHKFLYGSKQQPCCFICGNMRPDGPLKLLEVYEEYSEEIVELFKKRIIHLDKIKIVYYDYDPNINMESKLASVFSKSQVVVASDTLLTSLDKIKEATISLIDEELEKIRVELSSFYNYPMEELKDAVGDWISQLPEKFKTSLTSLFLKETDIKTSDILKKSKSFEKMTPLHLKIFLHFFENRGQDIVDENKKEFMELYEKLEKIIAKPGRDLEGNISTWLNKVPEDYKSLFVEYFSQIKSCKDSFNNMSSCKGYEINVNPIMKKIKEFEKKRYGIHIVVIRLLILSSAVRNAVAIDLTRYLQEETVMLKANFLNIQQQFMVAYEIQPGDQICRYVDVDQLLAEE